MLTLGAGAASPVLHRSNDATAVQKYLLKTSIMDWRDGGWFGPLDTDENPGAEVQQKGTKRTKVQSLSAATSFSSFPSVHYRMVMVETRPKNAAKGSA